MKNNDYWKNRAKILEKSLLDKSYDYTKNLEKQFDIAIKDVEKDIASWYQKFATNNGITLAEAQKLLKAGELKEFQWTVEEYIKYGQENALSQKWIKQLKNASARVHITRLESLKIQLQQQAEMLYGAQNQELGWRLGELYTKGYYHTAFEIQRGLGVGWTLQNIDHEQIKKVLSRPWTLDSQTFSDRIWKNKAALVDNVTTSLTQMIMRGDSPDKAIKTIADKFGVSKRQAGRLVMTESAAFANEARNDCFNDLGVEKFVISETLDKETCPLCGQLDGKVFPMKEYAVGITAPPFHPWCRGTTAPWFEDMQELIDRAARDNDGKTYTVPGNMKYEDWAKKYINSPGTSKNGFTNGGNSGIISNEELKKNLEEMLKQGGASQADSGINNAENGNIAVSDCLKKIRAEKQLEHILGTPEWTKASRAEIAKGKNPKSAFYKNIDPQEIVNKFSGTGILEYKPRNSYPHEFVDVGKIVGISFDKKVNKYVPTSRIQIVYSKKGVHLFPVLPRKE